MSVPRGLDMVVEKEGSAPQLAESWLRLGTHLPYEVIANDRSLRFRALTTASPFDLLAI